MALEYFPCYHSYRKKCEKLTDQELGRLFRALMVFSETGEAQELAGRESIAFDFIADDICRAKTAYSDKCRTNRRNGAKSQPDASDRGRTGANGTDRGRTGANATQSKTENKTENKGKVSPDGDTTAHARESAVSAVLSAYMDRINPTPSSHCLDELKCFAEVMGTECCLRAMDIAIDERKTSWSYIRGILRAKQSAGVKCLGDWDALEEKRREARDETGSSESPFARFTGNVL